MRLIDADAVLAALGIFHRHDNDKDNARHFMNGIETAVEIIEDAPNAEAVPIKPLAEWLAGYAMPPGGIKARKAVGKPETDYFWLRAEAWEEFLRVIDWEADNEGN